MRQICNLRLNNWKHIYYVSIYGCMKCHHDTIIFYANNVDK